MRIEKRWLQLLGPESDQRQLDLAGEQSLSTPSKKKD